MSRFFKRKFSFPYSFIRGFSIVEVLVTLAITTVIISTILSSQSKYVDGAALSNVADEIGLTISQAQAYGIAVRELSPGSANFSAAYGLSISILSPDDKYAYIFFADRNANASYDGDWTCALGGSSECLEKVNISRGNYIDTICEVKLNGADQCNNASRVDISFIRPHPEAVIKFYNNGGQSYSPANIKGVRITLKSLSGASRSVVVYSSGQISVQ